LAEKSVSEQFGKAINAFRGLLQRIKGWMMQVVPEWDELCEFDCCEDGVQFGKVGACEKRLERFLGALPKDGSARPASPHQPGSNTKTTIGSHAPV